MIIDEELDKIQYKPTHNYNYNHRILDNENPSNFDFDQLTTIECDSYTCI